MATDDYNKIQYYKLKREDFETLCEEDKPTAEKLLWAAVTYFFTGEVPKLPNETAKTFRKYWKNRIDNYRKNVINGSKNKKEKLGELASLPADVENLGTTQGTTHTNELGYSVGSTVIKKEIEVDKDTPTTSTLLDSCDYQADADACGNWSDEEAQRLLMDIEARYTDRQ